MESRVDKFSSLGSTRSARNAKLYQEVYGKYHDLDNLPLEDNTDEIDMNRLQEIIHSNESKKQKIEEENSLNIIEQRKKHLDEQRVYDINKILEKAKYENHKLKETTPIQKVDTSILSTLQNRKVTSEEIVQTDKKEIDVSEPEKSNDDEFSMTRELKFKELSNSVASKNSLMEHVMPNNDLSLDLFENLKPSENTITTKPINQKELGTTMTNKEKFFEEIDVHSGNTKDIDIIKENTFSKKDNDFFTSSYEFSDNDFFDDEPEKKGGVLKIILLILSIIAFAGVITYFVINYGLGT